MWVDCGMRRQVGGMSLDTSTEMFASCPQNRQASDRHGHGENKGGCLRSCAGLSHDIWLGIFCTITTG
jgi:hypothetical protein